MNKKSSNIVNKLFQDGYCILPDFLNNNECKRYKANCVSLFKKAKVNKYENENSAQTGQIAMRDLILRKPNAFLKLVDNKKIMDVCKKIFKSVFILDTFMASNSIKTNIKLKPKIHIDSHLAIQNPKDTTDVVVLLCLDDFKRENGATKIFPKSHLTGVRIQDDEKYLKRNKLNFKYAEAKKGSVIFILGQTWHQIGHNIDSKDRWAILISYKQWWIKPSTDFTKCGERTFKLLNNSQKKIFGFNSIAPKFDLKKFSKPIKTLRDEKVLNSNLKKVLNY